MWACVFLACLVAGIVEATSPYCFDIDKKTGKQLCCPLGKNENGVCVEYLPKNSLRHMKGVESIEQFNETKAYVVSPPQDSDESCCCLEEKERMLLKTVVAEGGETYEVAQSDPNMVQPVETVICRLTPCITPSHRQDKGIRCSQKWKSWEVYVKDPANEDRLRVVSFKVPSGCLCASNAEGVQDRKLQDPSAFDLDHWLQTEVRRLFLNADDMYDTHPTVTGTRTLRYPVKRQTHNTQGSEAMSTVRILALILSKVEPSARLPIFQEVKGIMSEKVNYMREARKIIEAIFGGGGTADGASADSVVSSAGSTAKPNPGPQPQETEDTLKVKVIQFLLRRVMAEVMCNATVVVKLDEHKTPSFLPPEFARELQRNGTALLSPVACVLVSTALRCGDTDVLEAISDGRLARMIVGAETVSEGIAKVLDDNNGKISAVFQLARDNTTSQIVIDESKVAEIQGFFDRVLKATGNSASTTISETTVWITPTGNDNPSTFGMSQQTVTLPIVTSDPVNVTPSNSQGSEEPMVNPVIPPGDQLPPSEYMSFNDTGAVLSSFLNGTAEGGKPVTPTGNDNPSTFGMPQQTVTLPTVALDPVNVTPSNSQGSEEPMVNPVIPPGDQLPPSEYASFNDTGAVLSSFLNMTAEGGKPVTLTTSAPIQTVMESGTTSISEVQTEETPTTTVTSDFPSTVTVEISEATTTFTDSSATDGTMESSFSVTTGKTTTSFTDETTYSSLTVTKVTEYSASMTEEETTASVSAETYAPLSSTDVSNFQTETTTETVTEDSTEETELTTTSMTEGTESNSFLTTLSMTMGITTEETTTTEESTASVTNESVTEATVTGESTTKEISMEEAATTGAAVYEESTPRQTATEGTVTEGSTSEEMVTEETITEGSTLKQTTAEGTVITAESTPRVTATEAAVTKVSTSVTEIEFTTPLPDNAVVVSPVIPLEEDLPEQEYQPVDIPVEFILNFLS